MAVGPENDMGMHPEKDGGGGHSDMAGHDGGGVHPNNDMGGGSGALPCSPGGYSCGPANSVQICNSTGTAWLTSGTCAVSCIDGLCTGACSPGAVRCNMNTVEQCDPTGTVWNNTMTCPGSCESGTCAMTTLDITMNQNLDGEIYVDGDFYIRSGVTVTSQTGELTIHAQNITIENMGTLTSVAKGNPNGWGQGGSATSYYYSGGGGGNATSGNGGYGTAGGSAIGNLTYAQVFAGGNGGSGSGTGSGVGGMGGGAIRLIASDSLTIAGFVTANGTNGTNYVTGYVAGGGGGGAGGGILLAASGDLTVGGAVSATGGSGGSGYYTYNYGGAGSSGSVMVLAGGMRNITGTLTGSLTQGLLPPLTITSSSHPDPTLIYNDNFESVELAWVSPFSSRQGYYQMINTSNYDVPTPANSMFVNTESSSFPASSLTAGSNFFHVTPVDAMSDVGTVENAFMIQMNSTPPTLTSSSHPEGTWTNNPNVFLAWTLPVADNNTQGVYYVFDNYGDTVPDKTDTFVPLPQKNQLLSGEANGIWVMHVVAMDQRGYLTKAAGNYRVQIGTDPGNGVVLGQVTDGKGMPISNADVSINRGLWDQPTNTSGNFNFATVSAGTYELRATVSGKTPVTQMITVTMGNSTTANVSIP
jgi:hypothetical protein